MARFSLGGEEDEPGEAPGSSSSGQGAKRRKISRPPPPPPSQPPPPADGVDLVFIESEPENQIEAEEEEEEAEEESSHDDEEEEKEEEGEEGDDRVEDGLSENLERPGLDEDTFDNADPLHLTLTLTDSDVFDCPICLEPLSSPVFQCENGHIACSSCCVKVHNKCPTCAWPTGYNRCRAMEKVLEAVRIACRYAKHGCRQMLNLGTRLGHEYTCSFGPCVCPLSNCGYIGPTFSFYSHFGRSHPHAAKKFLFNKFFSVSVDISKKLVVLRESKETTIFVLTHCTEYNGSMINIVRIASSSTPSPRLSYDLTAKHEDTSITLHSPVESISKWSGYPPPRKFILVPRHYVSSTGQFDLDVCIWKDPEGGAPNPAV